MSQEQAPLFFIASGTGLGPSVTPRWCSQPNHSRFSSTMAVNVVVRFSNLLRSSRRDGRAKGPSVADDESGEEGRESTTWPSVRIASGHSACVVVPVVLVRRADSAPILTDTNEATREMAIRPEREFCKDATVQSCCRFTMHNRARHRVCWPLHRGENGIGVMNNRITIIRVLTAEWLRVRAVGSPEDTHVCRPSVRGPTVRLRTRTFYGDSANILID